MNYRKGDLFVHKAKGTIAVVIKVDNEKGTFDFKHSNPNEKGSAWHILTDNSLDEIKHAVDEGFVVMYRPYTNFLDDSLFEVD
jgi:hypothetical protein